MDNRWAPRMRRMTCVSRLGGSLKLKRLALALGAPFVIAVRFLAGAVSSVAMVATAVWLFHGVGYHHGARPLVSNALFQHTYSFDQPLFVAGTALIAAAFACFG